MKANTLRIPRLAFGLTLTAIVAALLVTASVTLAANAHFIGGPTFTDNGTTLTTCATIAGLGNEDVTVTVSATGLATGTCTSPGGNEAPGQNPIRVTLTGTVTNLHPENGRVDFCVTTGAPPNPPARQLGCPNNNWTATITDVQFQRATITATQGGQVVLNQTFNNP
jgi:hypothetical protein